MKQVHKKWEILGKFKNKKKKDLDDIVKVLLTNRGIKTKKQEKEFFDPPDPERISLKELGISLSEIKKAISRIKSAKKKKERVIVYGDYDADGICATAIMWEALHGLGLDVMPYIPERFSEGYGLNIESIKRLKENDPKIGLIVTVDHGIVADKKIDVARELGIDVIITDHHTPGKIKPKSFALVHTTKISGSGVSWVFAREISRNFKSGKGSTEEMIELVAIGTIADQLPLLAANRSFVKYGLERLRKTRRKGLIALFEQARLIPEAIGTYEVGFIIAPRINAAGRLNHGLDSLRLLCTKNNLRARELAGNLGRTNLERQRIVEEVFLHARQNIKGKKSQVIVLADASYHEGVIGLAAGRLVEEFYRPAIVIATSTQKEGIAKASARSIIGFNIIETIRKLDNLILEGGGHPMAAGFSIELTKIEEFTRKINEISEGLLSEDVLTRSLRVDLELDFDQIDNDLFSEIKKFEPTGYGNPTPTFVTKKVEIVDARVVGRDANHLKLTVRQGKNIFGAIAFGKGELYPFVSAEKPLDVVYTVDEDSWNGSNKLQLKIKDLN